MNKISEIIKDKLYLSGIFYGGKDMVDKGIKTVINVSRFDHNPYGKVYKFYPLMDVSYEVRLIAVAKKSMRVIEESKGPVLVHCVAGVSRAPSVVIYYLMQKYGICYNDAYNWVKRKRPIIKLNKQFVKQLQKVDPCKKVT
jgi:protein-tyrosine phosphatase